MLSCGCSSRSMQALSVGTVSNFAQMNSSHDLIAALIPKVSFSTQCRHCAATTPQETMLF
eukprot:155709-Amphidinium_carterae.2